MKHISRALAATTALTLSMSGALANDNEATLEQIGRANEALIIQDAGSSNQAGWEDGVIRQNGNGGINDLIITQSGAGNRVGTATSTPFNSRGAVANGASVSQRSNASSRGGNDLDITQTSNDNTIGNITQNADTAGATENQMTLLQEGGDGNAMGSLVQQRTGRDAAGHVATLTQTGTSNEITSLLQQSSGNTATATQTGTGNVIALISQNSDGNLVGNTAILVQDGMNNGVPAFVGGSFAEDTGATAASVEQIGTDNDVDYMAVGDSNQFGFYQNGSGNSVGMVTITGNGNQTAGYQTGTDNLINISPIVGDDNDVGVIQGGTMNIANLALSVNANRNAVGVDQDGTNLADVTITGDDNFVDVLQTGNNSGQFGVNVTIIGDFNGTGSFSGDAGTVAGLTLGVGEIVQNGMDNLFDMDIDGDSNAFAGSQIGYGNVVMASVDGNMNQFAVTQIGHGNSSTLTQNGNNNNAGISQ